MTRLYGGGISRAMPPGTCSSSTGDIIAALMAVAWIWFIPANVGRRATAAASRLSQATRNHGPATRSEAGSLPVVQPCEGMLFQLLSQCLAGSITWGRAPGGRNPLHSARPSPG